MSMMWQMLGSPCHRTTFHTRDEVSNCLLVDVAGNIGLSMKHGFDEDDQVDLFNMAHDGKIEKGSKRG